MYMALLAMDSLPYTLAIDPVAPSWLYIGTSNEDYPIMAYDASEAKWYDAGTGLLPVTPANIIVNPSDNSIVYTGIPSIGVYKSTNYANDWSLSHTGLNNTLINDLAVHPTSSATAFAAVEGYHHHMHKTINSGTAWSWVYPSSDYITDISAVAFDSSNPAVVFAGSKYIYRSSNGGDTWSEIHYFNGRPIRDIWVNPSNSNIVLLATEWFKWGSTVYNGGVYRSTDGGTSSSWTFVPCDIYTTCLASDPNNSQYVYAGGRNKGYVYRSTNGGQGFSLFSPGGDWKDYVYDLVVDSASKVYAATDDGLMLWNGSNWSKLGGLPGDDIRALAIDRNTSPDTIYAGVYGMGVYFSQNGSSWSPFNGGLGNLDVQELEVGLTPAKRLYAGTAYNGVWSTPLPAVPCPTPAVPGNPSPLTGATDVPVVSGLDWSDCSLATSYDVYFGTSSPPPKVGNVGSSYYDPGTLAASTQYYWKIAAKNSCGETTGPEWNFTTGIVTQPIITLSRSSLNFGAATGGQKTSDQQVLITNTGSGTLDWSVSDNAAWLSCSPLNGSGSAVVDVAVNPAGLAAGTYNGTFTVSSTTALNSPQGISVTLKVYNPAAEDAPFGVFDTPASGATVSGNIPVTGWALDDIEVTKVEIKRSSHPDDPAGIIGPDGLVYVWKAYFVKDARSDVEAAYPTYPLNNRAGWGCMVLTNFLPNSGNGDFTLYAFAHDANGNKTELGQKLIHANNANRTKPFGSIDTPGLGQILSGTQFIHFAWALTPQPKMIPINGSTIWVWIDSVPVGHPTYNQYRSDIANLFPGYANSNGAVGFYVVDLTPYENGIHRIEWSVTDDQGAVDGMSRYFEIQNLGSAVTTAESQAIIPYLPDMSDSLKLTVSLRERGNSKALGKRYAESEKDRFKGRGDKQVPLVLEIEELERIVLELNGQGGVKYLGWGKDETRDLPIGSTLDSSKGVFYWNPGPGFLGAQILHFAVTDGIYLSKPVEVVVNIMPKKYRKK
jgi:hypothetical protein